MSLKVTGIGLIAAAGLSACSSFSNSAEVKKPQESKSSIYVENASNVISNKYENDFSINAIENIAARAENGDRIASESLIIIEKNSIINSYGEYVEAYMSLDID